MKNLCILLLLPTVAVAEIESQVPYGFEAVTGYRSKSVHRGIKLADDVFDFQLQTGFALNNEWSVSLGGWYAKGSDRGSDFTEKSGFVDLRYDSKSIAYGMQVGYRNFSHSSLETSWEMGPFFTWHMSQDWDFNTEMLYDTGAEAWVGKLELSWSEAINQKSFFNVVAGVDLAENYYERDGLNDIYTRLSYTYDVASNVSITPFVGSTLGVDSDADDTLFGGLWLEVTF